jgi:hypothetical protein
MGSGAKRIADASRARQDVDAFKNHTRKPHENSNFPYIVAREGALVEQPDTPKMMRSLGPGYTI